jgi:NAD(P)H dehydrogenase (quinone)
MTTLIVGATGTVAAPLTKDLLENGPVRALARSREKALAVFGSDAANLDLVVGAFDDDEVLEATLDGVDLAFLALGSSPQQVQLEIAFIDAAARARLPQLVKLSTADARHESLVPVGRWHAEIEDHLRASGVSHTLLQPSSFSSNLLAGAAPSIAGAGRWFGSAPSGRTAFIDTRDVSEAAAAIIGDPALQNKTHVITGPEALTNPEVARLIGRVLDRQISYVPVDEDAVRKGIKEAGLPDVVAEIAVGINRAVESGSQAVLTTELEPLIGHAPRTVERFVQDHRAAFGG